MTVEIEKKNQELVTDHLQQGYELVFSKPTSEGLSYLLAKGTGESFDLIVVKSGKVSFQKDWNEEKMKKLVSVFKNALTK